MHNPAELPGAGLGTRRGRLVKGLRTRAARALSRWRQRIASPRAAIARLGALVAIVIAIAPPATYAWISASQLGQRVQDQAALGARHIEVQLAKGDSAD